MILLAGGTGHLGHELVPLLQERNREFRVLTRNPQEARQKLGPDVEFVRGDATDAARMREAMNGVDTVVSSVTGFGLHAAGVAAVDLQGNLNLIRAAEAAGVSRFVLLSMHGAAPGHPMKLLRMKHRAEEALRASKLGWMIVRPTAFAELWAGIIGDPIVRSGKATVFGRGDNPINFVSAADLAAVVELALGGDLNQTVDVGGPGNMTLTQVASDIAAVIGCDLKIRHVPLRILHLGRVLLQPFRPDLAGFAEAAISMAVNDMTFDAAGATSLRTRFPYLALTPMHEVIRRMFSNQRVPAKTVA